MGEPEKHYRMQKHTLWLLLYEISGIAKPVKIEGRLIAARVLEEGRNRE